MGMWHDERQPFARLAADRQGHAAKNGFQRIGAAGEGLGQRREALGEDATRTADKAAAKTADREMQMDAQRRPRQILHHATVLAVDA